MSHGGFVGGPQAPPSPRPDAQQSFCPGSMDLPTSSVELSIKCTDLENRDYTSKSDPVCVMFQSATSGKDWYEVGRTEIIKDSLNPAWERSFVVDYCFEQRQFTKFEIYDWDEGCNRRLDRQDFLGRCETTLGQIASSREFRSVLKDSRNTLTGDSKRAKIFIVAEELQGTKEEALLELRAEHLDKKDFFGKSDPFLVISKESKGQWTVVQRTEIVMKNLNPVWKPFHLPMKKLCNGNYERRLKFDVYDWDSDGGHDHIGSFITTMNGLKVAPIEKTPFGVISDHKKQKKGSKYKNSGVVYVTKCQIATKPSFLDYLQSGTSMNFSVAVDFTASNGDPMHPKSLHYLNPQTMENEYTTAIRSVGDIVQDYDTDKQFPALGFGARVPPDMNVSHEFFLNLRPDSPFCAGIDGLLAAYRNALLNVKLYGPTNFSPVINHVAKFARAYQLEGKQYFVLLILTDGIITDMEATVASIVSASDLPMSIIIVGVGNENFDAMDALDSDGKMLRSGSSVASRDIVQFVELRKFVRNTPTGPTWSKEALAREVLAEIPDQLVSWMTKRGIKPP